ncbi:MAG: CBS domain-containing protein [Saprospiraceae bacterium]|nr:CBS domain-containing protein [Saprospiraceae bacterium]
MLSKTPISQIMTKDVVVLDINDNLTEAERVFGNRSLRHAPVLDNGQVVGMLSLVDLRRNLQVDDQPEAFMRASRVGDLMTPDPVSVQVNASVLEVASIFTGDDFHAIPVLEGDRIAGIVSTTDIIKFLIDSDREGD